MDLGTEYDYKSIMHYPDNAFGIPTGEKTIISKTKTKIKHSKTLTPCDVKEIRNLYNCDPGSSHDPVL